MRICGLHGFQSDFEERWGGEHRVQEVRSIEVCFRLGGGDRSYMPAKAKCRRSEALTLRSLQQGAQYICQSCANRRQNKKTFVPATPQCQWRPCVEPRCLPRAATGVVSKPVHWEFYPCLVLMRIFIYRVSTRTWISTSMHEWQAGTHCVLAHVLDEVNGSRRFK